MSEKTVKIGMIGVGYWGPNLLRNYVAAAGCDVRIVADRSAERRAFAQQRYPGLEVVTEADEIFDRSDIDAVVIATPAASHYDLVKVALNAAKDVFVEKPLALDTEQAGELAALADQTSRVLMVGHTFLFNDAVRELKRRIDAGEIGNVHYLYSQRLNLGIVRSDIGASWNLAPHDLSIGAYLLGCDPETVTANGISALRPGEGLEDVVFLNLRYPNGITMNVHASWLDPRKARTMTVVGDKKMIVYDDVSNDKLQIYDKGITKDERVPEEQATEFARFKMISRAGDLVIPNMRIREPLAVETAHFIECVQTRARPLTDAWSGVAVTATLEAADRSLKNGGAPEEIRIPRPQKG